MKYRLILLLSLCILIECFKFKPTVLWRTLSMANNHSHQHNDDGSNNGNSKDMINKSHAKWWVATPISKESPHYHDFSPNNFGDLVAKRETNVFIKGNFSPVERLFLTANGNLQRMLSGYFGAPISIDVLKSEQVEKNKFDREIVLRLGDEIICHAKGEITIFDESCLRAIESKEIGVGQLFRFLGILPTFRLIAAGKLLSANNDDDDSYSLWRDYEMTSKQFACRFVERFSPRFLSFQPTAAQQGS